MYAPNLYNICFFFFVTFTTAIHRVASCWGLLLILFLTWTWRFFIPSYLAHFIFRLLAIVPIFFPLSFFMCSNEIVLIILCSKSSEIEIFTKNVKNRKLKQSNSRKKLIESCFVWLDRITLYFFSVYCRPFENCFFLLINEFFLQSFYFTEKCCPLHFLLPNTKSVLHSITLYSLCAEMYRIYRNWNCYNVRGTHWNENAIYDINGMTLSRSPFNHEIRMKKLTQKAKI